MSNKYIIVIIGLFLSHPLFSQEKVNWHSLEEAEKLITESPRPMFIDAYTEWCGWCKKMDEETFSNPIIAEILNTEFYPVKFHAESMDSIVFFGQTFINDGTAGKAHQLAVTLLQGQLSYPTVIIITPLDGKMFVTPIPGYREPKEMELLLSYMGKTGNNEVDFNDFQNNFKGRIE